MLRANVKTDKNKTKQNNPTQEKEMAAHRSEIANSNENPVKSDRKRDKIFSPSGFSVLAIITVTQAAIQRWWFIRIVHR